MQNCNNVNRFFVNKIYKKTVDLALFPISWASEPLKPNKPSYLEIGMLFLLAPLILEAAVTTVLFLSAVMIPSVIAHAIALATAALIDICQQQKLNNRELPNLHSHNVVAASY
jgi:hypothetical protein